MLNVYIACIIRLIGYYALDMTIGGMNFIYVRFTYFLCYNRHFFQLFTLRCEINLVVFALLIRFLYFISSIFMIMKVKHVQNHDHDKK